MAITGGEDSTQILGNYESIDIVYDYIPFTVTPTVCADQVVIKCLSVSPVLPNDVLPCQEIVNDKVTWNFSNSDFADDVIPTGTYTFTYEILTDDQNQIKTFTVDLELVDPC